MASFSPPTYDYSAVENTPTSHPGYALFRHYTWRRARSVRIVGGSAEPAATDGPRSFTQAQIGESDEGSGLDGRAFFLGGHTYSVTAAEQAALEAAGYEVSA